MVWQVPASWEPRGLASVGLWVQFSQTALAQGEIAQPPPFRKGAGLALVVDRRFRRGAAGEPGYVPHGSGLTRLSP